jgi:hypothetical protein
MTTNTHPEYLVRFLNARPGSDWEQAAWKDSAVASVNHFLPQSTNHRPKVEARLGYTHEGLHGVFRVADQYVRCVRTEYGSEVWKDSCVEFFVQPVEEKGYFNFEFNCGGTFLCCYIRDPQRTATGFKDFVKVPASAAGAVSIHSSLPRTIDPEIPGPVSWCLQFFIPFALLENYAGPLGKSGGQTWRGNFYKCADETSHPHWAAWSPVDELNFHLPRCFGRLRFE